jgi:hypothetical protein
MISNCCLARSITWRMLVRGVTRGRSLRFGSNVVIADAPLKVKPPDGTLSALKHNGWVNVAFVTGLV